MSRSSEEVLLIVAHVKNKKCEGQLYMMGERLAWMQQSKSSFTVTHNYADIKTQKISPDTKEKVQLQLILHDGGANTFHFTNPKGRPAQVQDREGIKELLQQVLPKFRNKVNSELEEKNRLLQSDPELFQLYKDLVVSGVVSAEEFWANRTNTQKSESKTTSSSQGVGISAAFLANIKPQTDGCNGLTYNLTPDTMESIFRTYPAVQQKHMECVPHKLTEQEFWTKFFQSHYFHRDRVNLATKDLFSDCAKSDDQEMETAKQRPVCDVLLDVSGLTDTDMGEGFGTNKPGTSNSVNTSLIKRFNQHSTRVLQACDQSGDKQHNNDSSLSSSHSNNPPSSTPVTNGVSSGRSSATSQMSEEQPPTKKARLRDKLEYEDLESRSSSPAGPVLRLTQMDRYLQGPTPITGTSYHTSEDIITACHAVGQEVLMYEPRLTQTLQPTTALSVLGELTPGGALMQGHSHQQIHQLVSPEVQQEVRQMYSALCELLRHFWSCFPTTSKFLEEKFLRMRGNLERFQLAKLNPFKQKLHERYTVDVTGHMDELLDTAYNKFNQWQTKRMGSKQRL